MSRVAIITGAGTGIGRALALRLAADGVHVRIGSSPPRVPASGGWRVTFCSRCFATRELCVSQILAVGRRETPLTELQRDAGGAEHVTPVVADVASADGRAAIVSAAKGHGPIDFLVQNAGTIAPIAALADIKPSEWEQAFAVNVHGPLFLLQALNERLRRPGARVLHIGSGAASKAVGGWTAYCATKAAFLSVYRSMAAELRPEGVLVGSVRPGIVNTPMQVAIRDADEAAMPDVSFFKGLHAAMEPGAAAPGSAPPSGSLDTPENVAAFLSFLLTRSGDDEFGAEEWDIRDASHHHRWTTRKA